MECVVVTNLQGNVPGSGVEHGDFKCRTLIMGKFIHPYPIVSEENDGSIRFGQDHVWLAIGRDYHAFMRPDYSNFRCSELSALVQDIQQNRRVGYGISLSFGKLQTEDDYEAPRYPEPSTSLSSLSGSP